MNTELIRSPDGKRSVTREYVGSIHFGPELHRARFDGFELPFGANTIFGDIVWSPDGLHLLLAIFHATRSEQTPDSELVLVTFCESQQRVETRLREPKVIEILNVKNGEALVLVGDRQTCIAY